jgi:glycolate oxidase FAD binding subunit
MHRNDSRIDSELRDIVRAGDDRDCVDAAVPSWVVAPTREEHVMALLRMAADERRTLICVGGRTSTCVGNRPRSFDVALDTRSLDQIVERRSEDMTITVQAGVTIESVAAELMSSGQRIAWDPDVPECATVGGVLATNSTGGLAHAFGQPRDLILGMTVIDGHARRLRLGGHVVKNVAGYDLVRLFTGSHGSLGVITEATLRTHPIPQAASTMHVRFGDPESLDTARKALFASQLPLAALDFEMRTVGTSRTWSLCLRVEGSSHEVDVQRDRIRGLCGSTIDEDGGSWRSPVHADDGVVVRAGVAPDDAIALACDLERTCRGLVRIGGRLGDGTLRVSAHHGELDDEATFVDHVRSTAHRYDGVAVFETMRSTLKRGRSVWDENGIPIALMREIKSRFDPHSLLAPGRFVGEI